MSTAQLTAWIVCIAGVAGLVGYLLGHWAGRREAERDVAAAWFEEEVRSLLQDGDDGDGGIRALGEPLHF